jgi:hypothetical protein
MYWQDVIIFNKLQEESRTARVLNLKLANSLLCATTLVHVQALATEVLARRATHTQRPTAFHRKL